MSEHEQTPFVIAFGKALFAVPDPCPWCGGVREYHPTSGGSSRLHSDGCAFFTIQHEHDKAVAALSARVAKLEAALACYEILDSYGLTPTDPRWSSGGEDGAAALLRARGVNVAHLGEAYTVVRAMARAALEDKS